MLSTMSTAGDVAAPSSAATRDDVEGAPAVEVEVPSACPFDARLLLLGRGRRTRPLSLMVLMFRLFRSIWEKVKEAHRSARRRSRERSGHAGEFHFSLYTRSRCIVSGCGSARDDVKPFWFHGKS